MGRESIAGVDQKLPAMKIPHLALLAALAATQLAGCCTMARLFCGADRSPWVAVSFESPRAALTTFLEAARRDDAGIAYRCLSRAHKQRLRNQYGLNDSLDATLAWERIKQEAPLHMLGYAEVPEFRRETAARASCVLDVSGRRFQFELVRQAYWSVSYTPDGATILETGRFLDGALTELVRLRSDQDEARVQVAALTFPHDETGSLAPDQLVRVEVGHEWKVESFTVAAP